MLIRKAIGRPVRSVCTCPTRTPEDHQFMLEETAFVPLQLVSTLLCTIDPQNP